MKATTLRVLHGIASWRMVVAFLMGFVCGLPLLLTGSLLQAWMVRDEIDLTTIGLFALVGLPYTLKFLWAPILDRYSWALLGRRRGWLLLFQLLLIGAIIELGMTRPTEDLLLVAVMALLLSFFSASQDIVVDAYRREDLADNELGLGSALYVNGYRIGMLIAGTGGLALSDVIPFQQVYLLMALVMGVGVVTTLLAPEPNGSVGAPRTLVEAVVEPFIEYFRRPEAVLFLLFILFYKLGDTMAAAMTIPFYLQMGFSNTEISVVGKFFGFWATIAGGLIGGVFILRYGIHRALWLFGGLQAFSTAAFAIIVTTGPHLSWLAGVVAFENLSAGMGTTAFIAFMASITDRRFTATQYALLSSLMGIPRVFAAAPTGLLAEGIGWVGFFIGCALIAIPGLLLLQRFAPWRETVRG